MLNTADMNDDFDFTTKGMAIGGVDERGKMLVTSTRDPNRKAGRHCMRILKSIFTQVGLVLVLIAYLFGGGYLFRSLELSNEYSECLQKHEAFNKKLNFSTSRVIGLVDGQSDSKIVDQQVRDALHEFASQLFILDFETDKDCTEIVNTSTGAKWNLANAVYFCATVITTIGYGHITPSTFWGRISCIIYGVIGIPMMLIYLAIIGNLLAKAFRVIYVNIICCRCFYDTFRRKRQKRRERLLKWEQALRQHEEDEARRRGLPVPPPKGFPNSVSLRIFREKDRGSSHRDNRYSGSETSGLFL
ncbi:hypothetical protein AHF37_01914 [Paragonimus kellicotti]|nr:hypothetical protein AHF37_01914 [Paragonimus kellicotti]